MFSDSVCCKWQDVLNGRKKALSAEGLHLVNVIFKDQLNCHLLYLQGHHHQFGFMVKLCRINRRYTLKRWFLQYAYSSFKDNLARITAVVCVFSLMMR